LLHCVLYDFKFQRFRKVFEGKSADKFQPFHATATRPPPKNPRIYRAEMHMHGYVAKLVISAVGFMSKDWKEIFSDKMNCAC
jgi:hypothetical protein